MTYLSTQPDKLGGAMGAYLRSEMIPTLETKMKDKGNEIVPYVNHHSGPLKNHYSTFYDSPRYSSGLTTLHNIYGFITETHMLKPFKQRVYATYDYLLSSVEFCYEQSNAIQTTRAAQKLEVSSAKSFPIDWEVDPYDLKQISFNGYEYGYKKSEVTGQDRLYYDRTKPITKTMYYLHAMLETKRRNKPSAYFLRRGFTAVEDRLKWNGVKLIELEKDTTVRVISYEISNYETAKQPYEKHYLHYNTQTSTDTILWTFRKGDFMIPMGTDHDRFILEMLEPEAPDSYFNWNFFDAVLQQKEGYSSYVFEDRAAELLRSSVSLKADFDSMVLANDSISPNEKLRWIYQNSPHYEKEHNRLPIYISD
jgi:hypothetical protein